MIEFEVVKKLKVCDTITFMNELYSFKVSKKYAILWNIHVNTVRVAALLCLMCNFLASTTPDMLSSEQSLWIILACFPFVFLALFKQKACRKYIFDKGYYTLLKK